MFGYRLIKDYAVGTRVVLISTNSGKEKLPKEQRVYC